MANTADPLVSATPAAGYAAADADLGLTVRGLQAGQRVFLRYSLKRILGRGGMGMVWLARDEKLDRDVALKFVPEMLFLEEAARDDLKKETRRSLELTHPNIVRIYDFLEDETMAAISMEYIDGPTLSASRVARPGRFLEPADLEPLLPGLCAALDYAHSVTRMVHRDLKPANIMLTSRNVVKITDFGIACSLMGSVARVSMMSSSGGTLVYMSPQQMRGEMPSHTDDIYALGATLYELLSGKPPFYSGDITLQVREQSPHGIAARRAQLGTPGGEIPPAWEDAIQSCLAKLPAQRPQSAGELCARLLNGNHTFAAYEVTAPTMRVPMAQQLQGEPAAPFTTPPAPYQTHAPALHSTSTGNPAYQTQFPAPHAQLSAPFSKRNAAIAGAGAVAILLVALACWPKHPASTSASTIAKPPAAMAAASVAAPPAVNPATTARGGLIIKTDPPGAMVQVGGEAVENTPAIFKGIAAGKYPLRIISADYETVEREIVIQADQFTDLGTIALAHSTGTIAISSDPEGGAYELKATALSFDKKGTAPEVIRDVPTGNYSITYHRDGWPDQVRTVQVRRNESASADVHFPYGTLAITSTPPGATVSIDNHTLGVTPLNVPMPPGNYPNIQIVKDGMIPANASATVQDGSTATADAGQLHEMVTALELTTSPAGLDFTVSTPDGNIRQGQTPAAIFDLPAGNYSVTYKRPGWSDFTTPVTLQPKNPVTINHEFPEGSVAITSQPSGAEIYHDSTLLGIAPLTITLPPGAIELTAKMTGMTARKHSVTILEGEEADLAFDMSSGGSSISAHHHHVAKKQPPSTLAKLGDSIKSFFAAGNQTTKSKDR